MRTNKVERNSSIELLRIISMLGVIILHYNNPEAGGGFKYVTNGSLNQYYLFLTENLFVSAVDLFIVISAFYLSKTKERKIIQIIELNVEVIFFRLVTYLFSVIVCGETLSVKTVVGCLLPVNYFVILYSVLYLLSPYVNVLIENISRRQFKKLIILLILIFSVWSIIVDIVENIMGHGLMGLSSIGMYGSQQGYCIVNFVLIYFIGAYIRVNNIKLKKGMAFSIALILISILYILSLVEHFAGLNAITAWYYNNPLVILLAAVIFLLFFNYNFSCKIINELAQGAFTCYLLHGYFINKVHIEDFVNNSLLALICHQLCVAIVLYLIAYVVYKAYSQCSRLFIRVIDPLANRIDISIKEEEKL